MSQLQFERFAASVELFKGEEPFKHYLKSTKADINTFDRGLTLLQGAVLDYEEDGVKILVKLGADCLLPCKKFDHRQNSLHIAAKKKRQELLKIMLSALKDKGQLEEGLKSTDAEGNTPLHHAARVGHMPCVQLLLEFGADATLLNGSQSSAIDVAGDAGKQDVAEYLMKQSRENGLDTGSSNSTDADELSSSPRNGREKEGLNYDIDSPTACLLEAVQKGDLEGVKQAIRQKADIDVCVKSVKGNSLTPLNLALYNKFENIAYVLLQQKANPSIPTTVNGYTPLHYAVMYGFSDVVKLILLDPRTEIDAVYMGCNHGTTPLHSAVMWKNFEVTKLLIESGADPKIRTIEGNATALEIAESEGLNEIADYLRSLPRVQPTSQLASKNSDKISTAISRSRKSSGILADVGNNHHEELENLKGQKKCLIM